MPHSFRCATQDEQLSAVYQPDNLCRILALDGGGAKGFYTLGVLKEIEAMLSCRLHQRFDLIFGTSTGAIIASLLALGHTVDEIHHLYKSYVPAVMRERDECQIANALTEADSYRQVGFSSIIARSRLSGTYPGFIAERMTIIKPPAPYFACASPAITSAALSRISFQPSN